MKKYLLLSMLFGSLIMLNAQTISRDKPKHFAAGFVIGGVGGYTAHKIFGGNRYWTWAGAIGSSLAAGVLKENIDKNEYGVWDNNDILFTVLGGAVSGLALDLLLKNKRRGGGVQACNCYAVRFDPSVPLYTANFMDFSNNGSHNLEASLQAQGILEDWHLVVR